MPDRDPNELADALRKMAQAAPADLSADASAHHENAHVDQHGEVVDPAAIEDQMAEHLAPLTPSPRAERPADPVEARKVRPPAPGTRAVEPVESPAPKPSLRPATPLDRPVEPESPITPPPATPTPAPTDATVAASPVDREGQAARPAVPEVVAPLPTKITESPTTGLDEIVDTDDDLIDMPAPDAAALGTPVWVDRPRMVVGPRRSLFFLRTLIPILLTLGVLAPAFAVWLMKLPEESNLRALGAKLSIGLIAAGVLFLILAAVNMYVVHVNLKRQADLDAAAVR